MTPEELINQIITNAMETASGFTGDVETAADALIRANGGWYKSDPDSKSLFQISAIEPEIPTVADNRLSYEANLANIIRLLSDQLAGFFDKYYPLMSDAFGEAQAWLVNVISNGGTGINPNVEAQVWQRAREQVITDGRRVENQILSGYAAKGIMLPAGAMLRKLEDVKFNQLTQTGIQATSIASKQLDIEIETVKFAIGKALESRQMAMNAAADYIKSIATAPNSALEIANINNDAQAKMMSAAATWYNSRLQRDEIILKSKLADIESGIDIWKQQSNISVASAKTNADALSSAADAFGKTAAAALSSLNSIVSTATNSFS